MNSYIILILIAYAAIMTGMTLHGAHRGFVRLIAELVGLAAGVGAMLLLSSLAHSYYGEDSAGFGMGILLLVVLAIVYKVVHRILSSIRFLSELPLLSALNKLLGTVAGFCEGFAILYAAEYLLRLYLLR